MKTYSDQNYQMQDHDGHVQRGHMDVVMSLCHGQNLMYALSLAISELI